jgi:hypothetical protein
MKTEEIINRFDKMKIDVGHLRNKWDKFKSEVDNINPLDNYGTEAVDRAFVDLIAAIDYSKFLIKG